MTYKIKQCGPGCCSVCKDKYADVYVLYPEKAICYLCLRESLDYHVCTNCHIAVHSIDVARNGLNSPECPKCRHVGALVTIGWYDRRKALETLGRMATMLRRAIGKPERYGHVIRIAAVEITNALNKLE